MKNQLAGLVKIFPITPCYYLRANRSEPPPLLHYSILFTALCIIVLANSKLFCYISLLKPTFMNLIERAKNIIISPAKEWDVIATETPDTGKIITRSEEHTSELQS